MPKINRLHSVKMNGILRIVVLSGREAESSVKIKTIIDQLSEEENHFYQKTK